MVQEFMEWAVDPGQAVTAGATFTPSRTNADAVFQDKINNSKPDIRITVCSCVSVHTHTHAHIYIYTHVYIYI